MGQGVYSLSDPRAVVFKNCPPVGRCQGTPQFFEYYNTIERLAPKVIAENAITRAAFPPM